jgi:hypothetical protein
VLKSLAAVSWGDGRIDLFWRGDDGALWHRAWSRGSWQEDESLGGQPTSVPAAVSWDPNELQVFAVASDGHLWNIYWDGTAWHHWVDMGGDFMSDAQVAASTWGPDRIDVFVSDAGALWHRWWNGSEWVAWRREDRPPG